MKQKLLDFFLPILLGFATMSSIVYCYTRADAVVYSAVALLYEVLLFFLLDKLYNLKYKKIRGFIYTPVLLVVVYLTVSTTYGITLNTGVTFSSWFYGVSQDVNLDYLTVLILGGGFIYVSMLYYFTRVRYRGIMTLMLAIIPFAIYAKRLDVISSGYLAFIIFSYLAVMVHNRQTNAESGVTVVADKAYVVSLVAFVGIITILVSVIPKPTGLSMQEKDAGYLDSLSPFKVGASDVSLNSSDSSRRNHGIYPSGEILFYVNMPDDELYLKRQSYSYFEDNAWHFGEEKYEDIGYVWKEPATMLERMSTMNKIRLLDYYYYANEGYDSEYSHTQGIILDNYYSEGKTMSVGLADGVSSDMYYTPQSAFMVSTFNNYDKSLYDVGINGEFYDYFVSDTNSSTRHYQVRYYDTARLRYLVRELSMTDEKWQEILDWCYVDAKYVNSGYDDMDYDRILKIQSAIQKEWDNAKHYHNGEYDEFDEEIAELAKEITKDCNTEYEKAVALENYFREAGFTYDLGYIPDDESIEYFIFESKTGICSDFATAMTLMARSVGLTARYCEGYLVFEESEDGRENRYTVRDSYGHAYVEIYLPAIGWTVFEPTVPGFEQDMYEASQMGDGGIAAVISSTGIVIAICVMAVLSILIVIFIKPICEGVYRVYIKILSKKNPTKALRKLYGHLVKRLSKRLKQDFSVYTAKELSELTLSLGVCIENLKNTFNSSFYGGRDVTYEQFVTCYLEYKSAAKLKETSK